jgi:hypothetical protein
MLNPIGRKVTAAIPNEWSEDYKRLVTQEYHGTLIGLFPSSTGIILALIEQHDGKVLEVPARCLRFNSPESGYPVP